MYSARTGKPYLGYRPSRNDAADAEAICEAVGRPRMRFVRAKSAEQQGRLMQHRTRDLLLRQQTQVINALRAHLAELGIVAAQGREGLKQLLALHTLIKSIEKRLLVQERANEASKRLESIPGIGIIGASAIAATVTDPKAFQSGRDF